MKVSYSNHPILESLQKKTLGRISVFKPDAPFFELKEAFFRDNWKINCEDFSSNINILSKPFVDAAELALPKLKDLFSDIVVNDTSDLDIKGTFVIGEFVSMISYSVKKGSQGIEFAFYIFDKNGIPLALSINSTKHNIKTLWASKSVLEGDFSEDKIRESVNKRLMMVIAVSLFKSYANVETKIINANSKLKDINCKYVNDTKLQLTYLDSKWFTNLVKSDGFSVRGHFRLQPIKKDGNWTRELIWIDQFEKSGYTSPAKIITQKNQ